MEQLADGRDYEAGKRLFSAALCVVCHRMRSEGGLIGPDLSSVASRFSRRDLLASIIEPSRVVAPPYQGVSLVTRDGRVLTGQPAAGGDYRAPALSSIPHSEYKLDAPASESGARRGTTGETHLLALRACIPRRAKLDGLARR